MQTQLAKILQEAKELIQNASTQAETEEIRVKFLGKKSELTEILKSMGKVAPEERKALGAAVNSTKQEIEGLLEEKFALVKEAARKEKFKASSKTHS